jgi:anti-sigma B factor antagonist
MRAVVRPTEFKITRTTTPAGMTLAIVGELDLSTVPVLAESVGRLGSSVERLTLDLSELSFMDSTGLRLLIELEQKAAQQGWILAMVRPRHEAAVTVLRVTGADAALPFEDPDEA